MPRFEKATYPMGNETEIKVARLTVDEWALDRIHPYERNPRKISIAATDKVAASLKEFGPRQPIVVDEAGVIIVGHTRLLAARKLGWETYPVHVAAGMTNDQKRAYRIADNRTGEESAWDIDLLMKEIDDLINVPLPVLGFDPAELAEFRSSLRVPLADPEHVPEPPKVPVSNLGDIWVLGDHRVICGDSTDKETVALLLARAKPHLMVTDPPYGIEYDASWRNDAVQAGNGARGAPSGRAVGKVMNDDRADWSEAYRLFPGDVAYVWHAGTKSHVFAESLIATGFDLRGQIIWAKSNIVISRGHYHPKHEPCWYAVRKGATAHWNGDRKQTTVWDIDKPQKSETGHSTQKPVECMRRPILNNSKPGDAVYEPFSGSGTTIIACEMEGRRAYAIELNPAYVDIAVRRWMDFTGKHCILEADGRTFDEVAAERHGMENAPSEN